MEVYGVDLARWWQDRRYRGLLELIDQLPQASRFMEAIVNDPEQADLIARSRDGADEVPWAPKFSEFGLLERLMRDAVMAIQGVQVAVIAAAGGTPPKIEPYPVPVTEIDRAVARANREWAESIMDIFTPGVRR